MTPLLRPVPGSARDTLRTLLEGLEHDAGRAGFELEPSQRQAAERLAAFGAQLTGRRRALSRKAPRSLYLHGPVGRGKTWLMDSFHGRLDARKRRVHFHDFFRSLHAGTHGLETGNGTAIQQSVDALLDGIDVLFFDEFHVHDVGDGMFIARLLRSAAQRRIPLVVTSNYAPEELLPNPLWHEHFLPTIEAIKEMMDIVEISGASDFRRFPAKGTAPATGFDAFRSGRIISPGTAGQLGRLGLFRPAPSQSRVLTPTTQPVVVRNSDPDLLWVDFEELCGGLTSTADFLVLAGTYKTWVIDNVPSPAGNDPASAPAWQRFSNVVDVLHDQDITLFLIGKGPLDFDIEASGGDSSVLPVDLARIASRLSLLGRFQDHDGADTPPGNLPGGGHGTLPGNEKAAGS
ncbi:cell division protein ZapE [Paenarthrobacter nicotinovorans]|uniref:cell division protein ZapE n=1 Tax=Micrococcaceae TaxID=1268 RepID=UPI000876C53F|nr:MULTISPECIES: cell division protein ZapE [Micrococcaceae]MDR6435664.1 cell division protein ZapE [Paenarthrobacter nicotinovorans]SCZ50364.1 cell division protein ZapE [Arthrobacter sp. UNCCL28]